MAITHERWQQAQTEERKHHTYTYAEGVKHYKRSYDNYLKYLGTDYNHEGKTIVEIGCADFPVLQHVKAKKKIVVEPMPSELLKEICEDERISLYTNPVERMVLPPSDEIWLLNVLQHVIDPYTFIAKCKASTKLIRFFEPLNYPADVCHPHVLTEADFVRWFGEFKVYNDKVQGFHQWTCAYGNYKVQ